MRQQQLRKNLCGIYISGGFVNDPPVPPVAPFCDATTLQEPLESIGGSADDEEHWSAEIKIFR
jgi:hypothetical protein